MYYYYLLVRSPRKRRRRQSQLSGTRQEQSFGGGPAAGRGGDWVSRFVFVLSRSMDAAAIPIGTRILRTVPSARRATDVTRMGPDVMSEHRAVLKCCSPCLARKIQGIFPSNSKPLCRSFFQVSTEKLPSSVSRARFPCFFSPTASCVPVNLHASHFVTLRITLYLWPNKV